MHLQPALFQVRKKRKKIFAGDVREAHPAVEIHPMVPTLDLERLVQSHNPVGRKLLDPGKKGLLSLKLKIVITSGHVACD